MTTASQKLTPPLAQPDTVTPEIIQQCVQYCVKGWPVWEWFQALQRQPVNTWKSDGNSPAETAVFLGALGLEAGPLNQRYVMGFGCRQALWCTQGQWFHQTPDGSVHELAGPETWHVKDDPSGLRWQELSENILAPFLSQCMHHDAVSDAIAFTGGMAGLLGYEAAALLEPKLKPLRAPSPALDTSGNTSQNDIGPWPEGVFIECKHWAVFTLPDASKNIDVHEILSEKNLQEKLYPWMIAALTLYSQDTQWKEAAQQQWDHTVRQTIDTQKSAMPSLSIPVAPPWQPVWSQGGFETAVNHVKHAIEQGEIYQANLSMRFTTDLQAHLPDVFTEMARNNPSPFSAYWQWGQRAILSSSPERLIQLQGGQHLSTRPIAGTRGRGESVQEDILIGEKLRDHPKEQAEHLMLVDMERNDLGRVCEAGSVHVPELMVLERYSHVTHLVSEVTGALKPEVSPWEVLQAVFPGGTITGCPKIRCMEILHTLEPHRRGPYTGSLGYISQDGKVMDWNILIRSMFLTPVPNPPRPSASQPSEEPPRYHAWIQAGAGIVADSVAAHEYRECLRKTASFQWLSHV